MAAAKVVKWNLIDDKIFLIGGNNGKPLIIQIKRPVFTERFWYVINFKIKLFQLQLSLMQNPQQTIQFVLRYRYGLPR